MAVYLIERNLKEEDSSLIIEGDTVVDVRDKDVTSVVIPDGIKKIGNYAFLGCKSLTSITIPNSVTSIERYAFEDCSRLKNITIPNFVTSIKYYAFAYCDSLKSVTIPDSVKRIGDGAFYKCKNLSKVKFEGDPSKIKFGGDDVFRDTPYERRRSGQEESGTAEDIIAHYDDGSGHGFDYSLDDSIERFVSDAEDLPYDDDEGRFTCSDEELLQAWRDYTNNSPDPNWLETNYGLSSDEAEIIEDYLEDMLISDYGSGS